MIRNTLDLDLLRAFVTVAETESFTRAATRLGLTQPAISLQIRRLEDHLDRRLFDRNQGGVHLTVQGGDLLPQARRLLAVNDEIVAGLAETEVEGDVRFGAPEDIASTHLPTIIARFAERHPRVRLSVTCDFTANLMTALSQGRIDLALVKRRPAPRASNERVFEERLVWLARDPGLFEARPVSLIVAPAPDAYRARALDALQTAGVGFREAFVSPSLAGQLAAVRAGLGVAIVPATLAPRDLVVAGSLLPEPEPVEIALLIGKGRSGGAVDMLAREVKDVIFR
ncbi:LysR family transcriptional regulator [Brevundimonas fluminis]|uniref:LysR family transcriptional regulator n=1 Tax=Brevundimonas fluminis TaxID=2487274 RepID=UPI001F49C68D|nr:LysR substrate-binding domain-containing protein [Brevundimonas fluminis]